MTDPRFSEEQEPSVRAARQLTATFAPDPNTLDEVGLGTYAARVLEPYARWVVDEQRWLTWDGNRWEPDDARSSRSYALLEMVLQLRRDDVLEWPNDTGQRDDGLRRLAAFNGIKKRRTLLEQASTVDTLRVTLDDLDDSGSDLVVGNGTVNLNTGELRRSRPRDLNTRVCTADYDPTARSALLDEYLDTFIPDDKDRRFVFAVLGDSLRVGNHRRWLPIFWGDTTSGKSQLFAALHRLLGTYCATVGASVFRGNLDDKPRPDLAMAMDTRVAYAQEASRSWSLHADQVKRITGQDMLPYRQLFGMLVNRTPRFTPMLVTNSLPRITGADRALKRRILAIHMDKSLAPGHENPQKREAFAVDPDVYRALLARLVAGARDPVIDDVPERYALATMSARAGLDHVDEFLDWMADEQYLVVLPPDAPAHSCVKVSELYSCYRYWLRKMADRVDRQDELGRNQFSQALRDRGWRSTVSSGTRWLERALTPAVPLEIRAQF